MAFVIGSHVAVLLLLANRSVDEERVPSDERMRLTFIEIPEEPPSPSAPTQLSRVSRPARPTTVTPAPVSTPAAVDSTALAASTDWYGDASNAASREATQPDAHDFGFPKRAPEPRAKKEFGWDKTHTERVSALPEGGMLIRLNDNCAIILAPLPLGGCSLGKRKARGDLFDEMKAPVEPGDWK